MTVRPLTPDDAPLYAALRLEMLGDSPWAFTGSPGEDQALDPAFIAAKLSEPGQAIIGAFEPGGGDRLLGGAGIYRDKRIKLNHRTHIWGVYVTPSARGRGLATRILTAALDLARSWPGVRCAGLSASVRSQGARRLYERLGFVQWGLEPGVVMIDGHACDEVHMIHRFVGP